MRRAQRAGHAKGALAAVVLAAAACASESTPPPAPHDLAVSRPLCDDTTIGTDAAVPATLDNVQTVFNLHCVGCHCCDAYLNLAPGMSHSQLVQRAPSNDDQTVDESCGGVLVAPGDAGVSYLYQKISSTHPCAGEPMPHAETVFVPLGACEQDLLFRWINAGAPKETP